MKPTERARQIRTLLNNITSEMTDKQAIDNAVLFQEWSGDGVNYVAGMRLLYKDVLYVVLQNHTSQNDWTPDVAVSLFQRVAVPDPEVIDDWHQPNTPAPGGGVYPPYMTGDKVRFEGTIQESLIDNNVWSPSAYPAGWQEVQ